MVQRTPFSSSADSRPLVNDVEFMAALMRNGIKVRIAEKAFSVNGQSFDAGTLIVTRRNNEGVTDFDNTVQNLARNMGRKIHTSPTGFVERGKDIGSSDVKFVKAPSIAVLFGEQTSSLSAGEIWHFFEQQIHYPITQIGTDYLKSIDLKKYDVFIVPEGNYRLFDEATLGQFNNWVTEGGKLIVIASGLNAFVDQKGFALRKYAKDSEKTDAEKKDKELREKEALTRYEDAERKLLSESISGAVYKVSLDSSHPLAFGLKDTYYTLKTNELRFGFLENGWNVGIIKGKAKPVQGFAGVRINRKLDNSLVLGVEQKGQGNIVYLVDNPLFRCFWESGKLLFSNAVFLVGQ